jgi:aldehyde:ferredoxin oxidoreductase
MPFGYTGKILHVNLTDSSFKVEEPGEQWYRMYMGGSAFGSYHLLKYIKPGIDPLSADNVLVFATSVVTGFPLSGFNRYTVAAKSPLTGCFGEAEAGGYFGPELKFAGFDAIVIFGKAPKPVYLYIKDGQVEFRDAAKLWGLNNWETLKGIEEEVGDKRVRVASIGPAGENLVRFACVANDVEHFNGRTGMGAVMGSKNLKAVAVRGTKTLDAANSEKLKAVVDWQRTFVKENAFSVFMGNSGTPGLVKNLQASGILPTRNFSEGVFDGAGKINWDTYKEEIFKSKGTCWMCMVACKRRVSSDDPNYPLDPHWGGPEYEALGSMGSQIGNDNLKALARGNQLCNQMGLDVISAGNLVAFVMECFENGILTTADTGGREVRWGDADAMLWLIEQIGHRQGIGNILAEGVKIAAEKIGRGSEKYAFHIKGNDLPMHDGRGKTGVALSMAISATGADHVECPHDGMFQGEGYKLMAPLGLLEPVKPLELDAAKVRFFFLGQKAWGINNLLSLCNFASVPAGLTFDKVVDAVQAITGWNTSLYEIVRAVDRSLVMARMFNVREGVGPEEDRIIRRWHEAFPSGPLQGRKIDRDKFQEMLQLYYQMSGWDEAGRPLPAKLVELNLEYLMGSSEPSALSA